MFWYLAWWWFSEPKHVAEFLILITNIWCVIDWINYCIIAKYNGMAHIKMSYIAEEGSAAQAFWKLVENIINNRFVQLNISSPTAFLTTSNIKRYIKYIFIYKQMYRYSHWHCYKLDHICFKTLYFLKTAIMLYLLFRFKDLRRLCWSQYKCMIYLVMLLIVSISSTVHSGPEYLKTWPKIDFVK